MPTRRISRALDDTAVEADESVAISLVPDAAYLVGAPDSATVTIISDDSTPSTPTATALRSPTANRPETGGDANGFEQTPQSAYADDTRSAVDKKSGTDSSKSCASTSKDAHRFYNYGFTLAADASIRGIEVRLDARADTTSGSPTVCIQLSWNGGNTWTAPKMTGTLTTSMRTYTLGSPTDGWERSWSSSDFTDANFRVRVINVSSSRSTDFSLDWITARVHYQ